MKTFNKLAVCALALFVVVGCGINRSSDDEAREQQEAILEEGNAQVGMPAIKNFQEKKLLKDILEMRDQMHLPTYTYMENMVPTVVKGHTAMGGKLTFIGNSIGYGIPYATQFTNPQKIEHYYHDVLPQADPNGLFSPASADGTWIIMKDPNSDKTSVVYIEPKIVVFQWKLPSD